MYDLLISGGRVIDPAQSIDASLDLAVNGDRVAAVGHLSVRDARQVVDASGKLVTPGLIDLHTHVFGGVNKISTDPDTAGVSVGVTGVGDAGSSGQGTFGAFPRYVMPASRTCVFCFLHIASTGLSVIPELSNWGEINPDAAAEVIAANRDVIKGVKVRMVGDTVAIRGVEVLKAAQKLARQFGLPVMVHIGDVERKVSPTLTRELLPLLEAGDILSHVFTAQHGSPFDAEDIPYPELREAASRGVVLDVAVGRLNFSFEVARRGLDSGIMPATISSDLTKVSVHGPVFSLPVTMSKMMAIGVTLNKAIEMATINPARALKEDDLGSLKPGKHADVSILEVASGRWKLEDYAGKTVEADRLIVPVMTVKSGQVIEAKPAAQPERVG